MEFWGVEVKSGNRISVQPGEGKVLHLSQACLGEVNNKGNESVFLYLNIDGQKHVLGTLYPEKMPQQQFDLVFEKDFELSHNWKNGSVYFIGYKAQNPFDDSEEEDYGSSDSEEDIPLVAANNGKPESKAKQEKPAAVEKVNAMKSDSGMAKQKVKIVEPNKDEKPDEDDDSSDESDDESVSVEAGETDSGEDSEGDESDEESDEETPKKVEPSKKRHAESASKTPVPEKKAKLVTPQKTDGKKGGGVHVATPHPSKQAGKTPANQPKPQTPKSAGSHSCKICSKPFNSDQALQSHTKAKHSAGK